MDKITLTNKNGYVIMEKNKIEEVNPMGYFYDNVFGE